MRRVFEKELSTTLNSDEAVARGCALQCAMLSPTFRVREFVVNDVISYPIVLTWKSELAEDEGYALLPFISVFKLGQTKGYSTRLFFPASCRFCLSVTLSILGPQL